jgi:proline iminopeptidase
MRQRKTAFLVHGGPGGDHSGMNAGYGALSDKMQVVYFDHRGQGRSARGNPEKYTLDQNVKDMEALRCYLGLGPIVSIGASYGGMVAMAHASRYPSSVSHLVLVVTAAHAGLIRRSRELVRERGTVDQVEACEDLWCGRLNTPEKMLRYFKIMGALYSRQFDPQVFEKALNRSIQSPEALMRAYAPDGCMRDFDLRPELGQIKAPTLIIAGRHDWICAPEFSEEMHKLIKGSSLRIFEESSHSITADEPKLLLDAITGFLVYNRI